MNLQHAYQSCLENGGVTYNLNGELNPDRGFMVATGKEESHSSLSPELVADYVKRHAVELADPRKYLGIWFERRTFDTSFIPSDKTKGRWVFDVSEIFGEKRNALFFGIIRNQRAIWDNGKKRAIKIK